MLSGSFHPTAGSLHSRWHLFTSSSSLSRPWSFISSIGWVLFPKFHHKPPNVRSTLLFYLLRPQFRQLFLWRPTGVVVRGCCVQRCGCLQAYSNLPSAWMESEFHQAWQTKEALAAGLLHLTVTFECETALWRVHDKRSDGGKQTKNSL